MATRSSFYSYTIYSPCRICGVVSVALVVFCLVLRNEITAAISSAHLVNRMHLCGPEIESALSTPLLIPITKVFGRDPSLVDMSAAGDEAWSSKLQTRQGGFLWVRNNDTVKEGWGVSMFHALHCLKMIRAELRHNWMVMDPEQPFSHSQHEVHKAATSPEGQTGDIPHMKHCLAYIAEVCCEYEIVENPLTLYARNLVFALCRR